VETRRARGFFSDERGRDDRRNLRPPGREIARILRAAALISALARESTGALATGIQERILSGTNAQNRAYDQWVTLCKVWT
jgi:hypothetical protein